MGEGDPRGGERRLDLVPAGGPGDLGEAAREDWGLMAAGELSPLHTRLLSLTFLPFVFVGEPTPVNWGASLFRR